MELANLTQNIYFAISQLQVYESWWNLHGECVVRSSLFTLKFIVINISLVEISQNNTCIIAWNALFNPSPRYCLSGVPVVQYHCKTSSCHVLNCSSCISNILHAITIKTSWKFSFIFFTWFSSQWKKLILVFALMTSSLNICMVVSTLRGIFLRSTVVVEGTVLNFNSQF